MGNIGSKDAYTIDKVKLINFNTFRRLNRFPRSPESKDISVEFSSIDRANSFVVYVSHCWHLRRHLGAGGSDAEFDPEDVVGFDGFPHPDGDNNEKYRLCVAGIEKIAKFFAPKMKNCFVWIDYSCINQDKAKKRSKKIEGTDMAHIQQHINALTVADCLFTPICGRNNNNLSVITANPYADYQSDDWNCNNYYSYLNRGWCRFDMFCAANLKLYESENEVKSTLPSQNNSNSNSNSNSNDILGKNANRGSETSPSCVARSKLFKAGLACQMEAGFRAHYIYGTSEHDAAALPIMLPPMKISTKYYKELDPAKGQFINSADAVQIRALVDDIATKARLDSKVVPDDRKTGYYGELRNKKYHGKGVYIYPDGAKYDGYFVNGKKSGQGSYYFTDGSEYHGQYLDGKMHGFGKYQYANGDVYEGEFASDVRQGKGVYTQSNGTVHRGDFDGNKRHGKAFVKYVNGNTYDGEFLYDTQSGLGIYEDYERKETYEGDFVDGKRHGKGILTTLEGRYVVNYIDGVIQSKTIEATATKSGNKNSNMSTTDNMKFETPKDKSKSSSGTTNQASKAIVAPRNNNNSDSRNRDHESGSIHRKSNDSNPPDSIFEKLHGVINASESTMSPRSPTSPMVVNKSQQSAGQSRSRVDGEQSKTKTPTKDSKRRGAAGGDQDTGSQSPSPAPNDNRPYYYIYPDGSTYFGTYRNGKRSGQGTYSFTDGCVYQGQYLDGKIHGSGKYQYANGDVYEGEFKEGVMSGLGLMKYSNGSRYEGQFENNKRHGKGKYIFPPHPNVSSISSEGAMRKRNSLKKEYYFEGIYVDDVRNGKGVCYYPNGDVYDGDFKDGKRHGLGTYRFENGTQKSGIWVSGELEQKN